MSCHITTCVLHWQEVGKSLDSTIAYYIHWHFISCFVRFIYVVFSFKFLPRVPWEIHKKKPIVLLSMGGCSLTFVSKLYELSTAAI